jgi:hypothetical protein
MSLISTLIEPHRVTRVFFDCRAVVPHAAELLHIEQAIERSIVRAQADDNAQELGGDAEIWGAAQLAALP